MKHSILTISALALFTCQLYASTVEQKIEKSFPASIASRVYIENINGNVRIETNQSTQIVVKAIKMADKKEDFDKVEIIFKADGNTLQVNTEYKKTEHGNSSVDYELYIPNNLALVSIKTINGGIRAKGEFAMLVLKNINGEIAFDGSWSDGTFDTVNGKIKVSHESVLNGNASALTINGSIVFEVNSNSDFSIAAHSINGSLSNDFAIPAKKELIGSSMHGKEKDGRFALKFKTVNGSIKINKI